MDACRMNPGGRPHYFLNGERSPSESRRNHSNRHHAFFAPQTDI